MSITYLRLGLVVVCTAGVFCGCSHQDFSRPGIGSMSDVMDSGQPFVGMSKAEMERRKERLSEVLSQWNTDRRSQREAYRIGPNDVLSISVLALEAPDRATTLSRTVAPDGMIALPFVGMMRAGGLSVRELEEAIALKYSNGFLRNPQIAARVDEYRSVEVVLTGAVAQPGIYYLEQNESSVLDMLAKAGGLLPEADDKLMLVRAPRTEKSLKPKGIKLKDGIGRSGTSEDDDEVVSAEDVIAVDLNGLIDDGDLRLNASVSGGDILTVRPATRRYVYVLGYVNRPGAFQVRSGQELDVVRAIAMAGGLGPSARAENSYLLRDTSDGQEVYPVDVTKITRGVRPPVALVPGDTLVIGSGFFARLAEFVKPAVGAGVSYSPVP